METQNEMTDRLNVGEFSMPGPKPLNMVDLGHIVHYCCEVYPEVLLLLDSSSHTSRVTTLSKCVSRLEMSRSIHRHRIRYSASLAPELFGAERVCRNSTLLMSIR